MNQLISSPEVLHFSCQMLVSSYSLVQPENVNFIGREASKLMNISFSHPIKSDEKDLKDAFRRFDQDKFQVRVLKFGNSEVVP